MKITHQPKENLDFHGIGNTATAHSTGTPMDQRTEKVETWAEVKERAEQEEDRLEKGSHPTDV